MIPLATGVHHHARIALLRILSGYNEYGDNELRQQYFKSLAFYIAIYFTQHARYRIQIFHIRSRLHYYIADININNHFYPQACVVGIISSSTWASSATIPVWAKS